MIFNSLTLIILCLIAAGALRAFVPNRATAGIFIAVALASAFALYRNHSEAVTNGWSVAKAKMVTLVQTKLSPRPDHAWPPTVNQPYPDLQLIDQEGRRTSLSEFKGKVILLEPVGMPCPACIAFAGGHRCGPFADVAPQQDLRSIEHYARLYGKVDLDDDEIVLVQVLFFSNDLTAPTAEDGTAWAKHFEMDRSQYQVVLVAEPYLLSQQTYEMIPGFQLIDKDFVLRYDSTGHRPQHDLYRELLPGIRRLVGKMNDE